uniref:hypothetical protein n=1 Tax=Haloprofundus sp. MHR1 TaxID=2572921 RepID=UPI001F2B4320|nr:hypothetical protein [Haloprofundus sp. MHR1]
MSLFVNGFRVAPSKTHLPANVKQEWTYQIHDDNGDTVLEFDETHDRLAHLILVRRDLTQFQHLHPQLNADGTWAVEFELPEAGVYRAFVDVLVNDHPTTLGTDLFVSGDATYEIQPASTHEDSDGKYTVVMSPEEMYANTETTVEFSVLRDDSTVQLEPYLGALGHLVALRAGDLAYLHVHPEETDPEDGLVRFGVRFPTVGHYRLFLQAKPAGELITTAFDVYVNRN